MSSPHTQKFVRVIGRWGPTPPEMYKHQCALLEDELMQTQVMLTKARASIAGMVHMNDVLMTGKADAEERQAAAEEKIIMLEHT